MSRLSATTVLIFTLISISAALPAERQYRSHDSARFQETRRPYLGREMTGRFQSYPLQYFGTTQQTEECSGGKVYDTCGSECPPTCDNLFPECTKECNAGCFCLIGLVEFRGECIREEHCPSVELPTAGAPSRECPGLMEYNECGSACPRTCENPNPTSSFCTLQCNPGCFCPIELVEFRGGCICEEHCPSVELPTAGPPSSEPSEIYSPRKGSGGDLRNGCATDIYIFAITSGEKGSESDDPPYLDLETLGEVGRIRLTDNLPGNQQSLNMGDFWRFNLKTDMGFESCITKSDITFITLMNGGTDGWGIASIITVLGYGDSYTLLTVDIDLYQMIDEDPEGPHSDYTLSLTKSSAI